MIVFKEKNQKINFKNMIIFKIIFKNLIVLKKMIVFKNMITVKTFKLNKMK